MADSQDIEAKLAAYVDGELPADARTQIEKYLSANPQQRRLIADLMRQRDLLQALPKNAAPADVAESLNAQLERAVLLGDVDAEATAGSIRPWRNVAGIAALVLLVGGLALTLYSLLPSPNRKPKDLSTVQTIPGTHPTLGDGALADSAAVPVTQPVVTEQEDRARKALVMRSEVDSPPLAEMSPTAAVRPSDAVVADMALPPQAALKDQTDSSPTTAPVTAPPLKWASIRFIEVATNDPASTRQQIIHTLTALGATVAKPTIPSTSPLDSLVVLNVAPNQMSQAIAVAQSFQPPLSAASQPSAAFNGMNDSNASAAGTPSQALNRDSSQQTNDAFPLPPATLPTGLVTIQLVPTTLPTTQSSTEPTSLPSTEPTTQP